MSSVSTSTTTVADGDGGTNKETTTKIRWGIIGCGDVCEKKSGPAFYKCQNSSLEAVMSRSLDKAKDFAKRHSVPRAFDSVDDIIQCSDIDMVYVATPPGGNRLEIAKQICLSDTIKGAIYEKPLGRDAQEASQIVDIFRKAQKPLYVAYYRRHLPWVQYVKKLVNNNKKDEQQTTSNEEVEELSFPNVGQVTSVSITLHQSRHLVEGQHPWHLDKEISGGGKFMDVGSHMIDLVDFLLDSPFDNVVGRACATLSDQNSAEVEDTVVGCWTHTVKDKRTIPGVCSFNVCCGGPQVDEIQIVCTKATISFPCFASKGIVTITMNNGDTIVKEFENPQHIHQPFIQSVIDETLQKSTTNICQSTAQSGLRASQVMDYLLNERTSWNDNYLSLR